MSRTVRRKQGYGWSYGNRSLWRDILSEHVRIPGTWCYVDVPIDPHSKEGKKRIARFHSDADYHRSNRGPGWWINEFVQVPYRQDSRRQIQKWMKDEDYEIIIRDKPKRDYWD